MFTIIRRLFAAFLTLFVFVPFSVPEKQLDTNGANMTAVVISDVHMEGNNSDRFKNLAQSFAGIASYSSDIDALITAGDNTMNGQSIEWDFFYGYLQRFDLFKKTNVIVAQGNHDFGNTSDAATYDKLSARTIKKYNDYTDRNIKKNYYSTIVNSYKVITLASDMNMEDTVSYISDEQLDWLAGELATEDGRPVIIVNHNLVYGTNGPQSHYYFNQIENGEKLREIMESYEGKVLYFSGHSHYGINDNTVVTQNNVTYVNITVFGGGGYNAADESGEKSGIGCVAMIYDDCIKLSFRSFNDDTLITGYEEIVIDL